ncbi:MAG: hypothetical protein IPO37_01130 [Saprospiraceae bacterium]|nr:hypothetical protein [Saprospiraceae bacterium]
MHRFKIFLVMDGALFVDAGNGYSKMMLRGLECFHQHIILQTDSLRCRYFLRLNSDFFIIRFDFGYKLGSPFTDDYKNLNGIHSKR